MGGLRPHGGTASSWGDCVLMGGLHLHGGTASSWGDCVLMGRLRPHGGTVSSWGDCILMGGLRPDERTACSYSQKKDPPAWTMLYSQASPCVLMCQLHLQRRTTSVDHALQQG